MTRSRPNACSRIVALAAMLLIVAAACSRSQPESVSPSDPSGWWNDWNAEKVEFPEGTRFEFETIFPDGSRGRRVIVVQRVDPAPGGGFNVTLGENSIFERRPLPPPVAFGGSTQPRNRDRVSLTTPAGTFLAGRVWRNEHRGHVPLETDMWLVPDIPLPVQKWSRPVSDGLYDPPSDGDIPRGTSLERLVRIQKQ